MSGGTLVFLGTTLFGGAVDRLAGLLDLVRHHGFSG
jgi:hypothetical protein